MRPSCILLLMVVVCCVLGEAQEPANQEKPLTGPVLTFDPAHQKPLSYEDESVQVTLVVGRERNSLRILERATTAQKLVPLPEEMAQADEIRKVIKNKLLVRGMVNGSGSEIVVIDLASARVIDKFLCYQPSVSPDGHYIAFVKFYPAHFAGNTEDHYMLYDLDKKSEENRPTGVPGDDWKNVGSNVYPIGIGNRVGDNVELPEGHLHESRSGFYWNSNGREFLFADQVNSSNEIDLVLVDIRADRKITVRTAQQGTEQVCSMLKEPDTTRSCSLLVRKVDFHAMPEPAFTVIFEVVALQKLVTFEYKSSQFHPAS